MNFGAITLFAALFVCVAVNAEQNELCKAYNGKIGVCIKLKDCEELLTMVKTATRVRITHQQAISIIQKSSCGFVDSDPLVCCPNKNNDANNKDTAKPPGHDHLLSDAKITPAKPHGAKQPDAPTTASHPSTAKPATPASPHHIGPESGIHNSPITPTAPHSGHEGFTNSPSTTPAPHFGEEGLIDSHTTVAHEPEQGGFTNIPTAGFPSQVTTSKVTEKTTTPVITTPVSTTAAPDTGKPFDRTKVLPADCGRVLSFKHFYGNQTEFDDFPWVTLVEYEGRAGKKFACGGALISKRYVLTAAHCVAGLDSTWKISGVRFGEYNTSSEPDCMNDGSVADPDYIFCAPPSVNVPVEEAIVHPGFSPYDRSRLHDVALLRLARDVEFTEYVKPICLPLRKPGPQRFYTSGWGNNGKRDGTDLKYMSYLTLARPDVCSQQYKYEGIYVNENQMCVGSRPSEQPCIGDDGSALMGVEERPHQLQRVTVFGILSITHSAGEVCKNNDLPGVYTKVLDYVPWILGQLRE